MFFIKIFNFFFFFFQSLYSLFEIIFFINFKKTISLTFLKYYSKFFKNFYTYNILSSNFLFIFIYFFYILKKKNKINKFSFSSFFSFFKFIFIFIYFTFFFLLFSFTIEIIPFTKLIFFWGSWGFFGYIFISGFIFFGKKYNFNKYTEALQRFWKRSFSIFWLLESVIFAAFIYLTFNSSAEVIYSYDPQYFFKLHLFSWKIFIFKLIFLKLILINLYFLSFLGSLKKKSYIILFFISSLIIYIFFIEFCQFLHFLNQSNFFTWNFNASVNEYTLDSELRKARIVNNYVLVCSIAKFWHIIFIFFIWFFNFNRYFELKNSRDYIITTNLQNFLILYILNWICMYPWFKLMFRYYMNNTFFWFFTDIKENFFTNFFFSTIFLYKSIF